MNDKNLQNKNGSEQHIYGMTTKEQRRKQCQVQAQGRRPLSEGRQPPEIHRARKKTKLPFRHKGTRVRVCRSKQQITRFTANSLAKVGALKRRAREGSEEDSAFSRPAHSRHSSINLDTNPRKLVYIDLEPIVCY